jgi:hypothetical protein
MSSRTEKSVKAAVHSKSAQEDRGTLELRFPELVQLLVQNHVFTLDFLRNDISTWFSNIAVGDIHRLWISFLSRETGQDVFVSFLIADIVFGLKEIHDLAPLCSEEFVSLFNNVKTKLPLVDIVATASAVSKQIHK